MYHIDNLRVATLSFGVKGHTASLPNRLKAAVFVSPGHGSLLSKLQDREVTGQSPTPTFKQLRTYQTSLWVEQEVMMRILSQLRDTNVNITLVFFKKQLLCCAPKPQRLTFKGQYTRTEIPLS